MPACLKGLVMLCLWALSWGTAVSESVEPPADDLQTIDAEIALLKAQLAWEEKSVERMAQALTTFRDHAKATQLPVSMTQRYRQLRHRLEQLRQSNEPVSSRSDQTFVYDPTRTLLLLPMSGDFAQAGQAVYDGIVAARSKQGVNGELEVVDTAVFDQPAQLTDWVSMRDPTLIIGPLRASLVDQALQWNQRIPMLVLNTPSTDHRLPSSPPEHVRVLSLSLDKHRSLQQLTLETGAQHPLILWQKKPVNAALKTHFDQAWLKHQLETPERVLGVRLTQQVFERSSQRSLVKALNVRLSQSRAGWLSRTLDRSLAFEPRSRADIDTVITVSDSDHAIQVSPLLNYFGRPDLTHFWLPSPLPTVSEFRQTLPDWQATSAILPPFFARSVQPKPPDAVDQHEVGTFYALGETVVTVLKQGIHHNQALIATPLGALKRDLNGQYAFESQAYWLDKGVFEAFRP